MKTQRAEALIGLVVLIVAGLFLFQILRGSDLGGNGDRYVVVAAFNSAEGITPGSEVRMAGVPIGKVLDLRLDTTDYNAIVDIGIDNGVSVPADSEVKVASNGLLGGAFVEIVPGADEAVLEAGDRFSYTNGAISLISLFAKFATGGGAEN